MVVKSHCWKNRIIVGHRPCLHGPSGSLLVSTGDAPLFWENPSSVKDLEIRRGSCRSSDQRRSQGESGGHCRVAVKISDRIAGRLVEAICIPVICVTVTSVTLHPSIFQPYTLMCDYTSIVDWGNRPVVRPPRGEPPRDCILRTHRIDVCDVSRTCVSGPGTHQCRVHHGGRHPAPVGNPPVKGEIQRQYLGVSDTVEHHIGTDMAEHTDAFYDRESLHGKGHGTFGPMAYMFFDVLDMGWDHPGRHAWLLQMSMPSRRRARRRHPAGVGAMHRSSVCRYCWIPHFHVKRFLVFLNSSSPFS